MKPFLQILLGQTDVPQFLALLFFSAVGAMISLLLQTTSRNIVSPRTPVKFSWQWLWQDNLKRIITAILLIYVTIIFCPQFLGVKVNYFFALIIGFGWDKLAQIVKDKTSILGAKLSIPQAPAAPGSDATVTPQQ